MSTAVGAGTVDGGVVGVERRCAKSEERVKIKK
jgi:hypothetical protein